jgi:hypothetical protein
MSTLERLKDIRELEFFLFGGIPESPEFMFERDSHNHVDVRRTRRGLTKYSELNVTGQGEMTAIIEIDPASGLLTVLESNARSVETR